MSTPTMLPLHPCNSRQRQQQQQQQQRGIVPTLSFSLSTPPEEEEPDVFAPPSGVRVPPDPPPRPDRPSRPRPPSFSLDYGSGSPSECFPLMIREEEEDDEDKVARSDSDDGDDEREEECEEVTPLLNRTSGASFGMLTSPHASRRASTQMGCMGPPIGTGGAGGGGGGLGATIAEFLQRRSSTAPSSSTPSSPRSGGGSLATYSLGPSPSFGEEGNDPLRALAMSLVSEAVRQAQERARAKARDSPGLRALVSAFVAEVLEAAMLEASAKLSERNNNNYGSNNNNNNEYSTSKGSRFSRATPPYLKICFPTAVLSGGLRTNPWMSRAARYFGSILDRICPCRSPFSRQ